MATQTQLAADAAVSSSASLIDQIMAQTRIEPSQEGYSIAKKGVSEFIAELLKSRQADEPVNKRRVDEMVAELDLRIGQQMDAILHHPQLQDLESAWRGLK